MTDVNVFGNADTATLVAVHMGLPELNVLCRANQQLNRLICNNERFWRQKYAQDYDSVAVLRQQSKTYKQQYMQIHHDMEKLDVVGQIEYAIKHGLDNWLDIFMRTRDNTGLYDEISQVLFTNNIRLVDKFMAAVDEPAGALATLLTSTISKPVYYQVAAHLQAKYFPDDIDLRELVDMLKILHEDDVVAYRANLEDMQRLSSDTTIANDALEIFKLTPALARDSFVYLKQAYKFRAPKIFLWLLANYPPRASDIVAVGVNRDFITRVSDGRLLYSIIAHEYLPLIEAEWRLLGFNNVRDKLHRMRQIIADMFPYVGRTLTIELVTKLVSRTAEYYQATHAPAMVKFYQTLLPPLSDHSVLAQRVVAVIFNGYNHCRIANPESYYLEYYRYYYSLNVVPTVPFEVATLTNLDSVYHSSWVSYVKGKVSANKDYIVVMRQSGPYGASRITTIEPHVTKTLDSNLVGSLRLEHNVHIVRLTMGVEATQYMTDRFGKC